MVDGHNTDLIIRYTIKSIKNFTTVECRVCCRVASVNRILKNDTQSNQMGAPLRCTMFGHHRKFSNTLTQRMLYACIMYLVTPYTFTIQVIKAVC